MLEASGCNPSVFEFGVGSGDGGDVDDASVSDGGTDDDGGETIDAAPGLDACNPLPEECNNQDDDCDTDVDENFNTAEDPANCGGCGIKCLRPHTAGDCNASTCEFACLPGFVDLDGDIQTNGCEYQCIPTNGGVEACDFADNDCDGDTDEGFNLDSDLNNCGGCGRVCVVLNATETCTAGVCGFSVCDDGFEDVLPAVPGCEYSCPQDPPAAQETCDNVDNDCDGDIDEQPIAGEGAACSPFPQGDVGECSRGQTLCQFGTPICQGAVGPQGEQCNGLDDDCDGVIDNGFDTQTNPNFCGGCASGAPTPCNVTNAIANCSGGVCGIAACLPGFFDANGDVADGCEYACVPSGPEVCDGVDNDCDTFTDTADPGIVTVPNFCRTANECSGTVPVCQAGPGGACGSSVQWRCIYTDPDVQLDSCGNPLFQETQCDDLDNDCDTRFDESFVLKGATCSEDGTFGTTFKQGVCRGSGDLDCRADETGLVCVIDTPGQTATSELCDGDDDDCDGNLDEGAPSAERAVSGLGLSFFIFQFEASRPDATSSVIGSADHRACSKPGVLPWVNINKDQAEAACAAAGYRLCTEAEWEVACAGLSDNLYPYGDVYAPLACNGSDFDPNCTPPDDDALMQTGGFCAPATESLCVSEFGAFDMSGNAKEWTSTQVGTNNAFRVRGGSFDNIEQGLTCDFSFTAFAPGLQFPNLGFRCCRN